jgi:hypothetical protein
MPLNLSGESINHCFLGFIIQGLIPQTVIILSKIGKYSIIQEGNRTEL